MGNLWVEKGLRGAWGVMFSVKVTIGHFDIMVVMICSSQLSDMSI